MFQVFNHVARDENGITAIERGLISVLIAVGDVGLMDDVWPGLRQPLNRDAAAKPAATGRETSN